MWCDIVGLGASRLSLLRVLGGCAGSALFEVVMRRLETSVTLLRVISGRAPGAYSPSSFGTGRQNYEGWSRNISKLVAFFAKSLNRFNFLSVVIRPTIKPFIKKLKNIFLWLFFHLMTTGPIKVR